MQFIVELEGGNDSSVDLTGDAGVVGRWLVEGDDSNPELRMDLKGVVYAATTVRARPDTLIDDSGSVDMQ